MPVSPPRSAASRLVSAAVSSPSEGGSTRAALAAVADACASRGLVAPVCGSMLARVSTGPPRWGLDEVRGRMVELSSGAATAALTATMEVVREGQQSGEPVAWISATGSSFCPDDVWESGIDLSALVVVRTSQVFSAIRSAERLLRSGAFGVVVLDLGANPRVPSSLVGKLVKLAQRHDAAVIALTAGHSAGASGSLGALVGMRLEVARERVSDGRFRCVVRVEKDKRRGPGWQSEGDYRGPTGLR